MSFHTCNLILEVINVFRIVWKPTIRYVTWIYLTIFCSQTRVLMHARFHVIWAAPQHVGSVILKLIQNSWKPIIRYASWIYFENSYLSALARVIATCTRAKIELGHEKLEEVIIYNLKENKVAIFKIAGDMFPGNCSSCTTVYP